MKKKFSAYLTNITYPVRRWWFRRSVRKAPGKHGMLLEYACDGDMRRSGQLPELMVWQARIIAERCQRNVRC